MAILGREEMSQREYALQQHEKEMLEMQVSHSEKIKAMDIELAKLEAKWSSWLKIPVFIIMLPVRILFAIAFIVMQFFKHEPSDSFWLFMR